MIWKCVAAVSLAVLGAPSHSTEAPPATLTELLSQEEDLARAAADLPPAAAIGSILGENVRLYARGGPYRGRAASIEALKSNPSNNGTGIVWRSIKSGVSGDGTHGFTLGYLTIAGGDPKTAERRYLAYWVKEAEGWRVAALKQALRQPGEAEIAELPISVPVKPGKGPDATARASLIAAEKAFSDRAQVAGIGRAFTEFGRSDAINSGPDGFKVGAAAIGAAVSGGEDGPSPVEWSADDALVAPSGDLGITFGMIRSKTPPPAGQPAAIPFFTIWMRDGPGEPWRYVAE